MLRGYGELVTPTMLWIKIGAATMEKQYGGSFKN